MFPTLLAKIQKWSFSSLFTIPGTFRIKNKRLSMTQRIFSHHTLLHRCLSHLPLLIFHILRRLNHHSYTVSHCHSCYLSGFYPRVGGLGGQEYILLYFYPIAWYLAQNEGSVNMYWMDKWMNFICQRNHLCDLLWSNPPNTFSWTVHPLIWPLTRFHFSSTVLIFPTSWPWLPFYLSRRR